MPDAFPAALSAVADVDGWLSDAQARRLWDVAREVPAGGQIVEIGSFRGRSVIVLARAAAADVGIVAIDPHGGGDRGPQEVAPDAARGDDDHVAFTANLRDAGVVSRVRHVRKASAAALGDVDGAIDLLYIDGAHRYAPARDDIASWGSRVSSGGTLLVHDSFNAIGVTLALLRLLVFGADFQYVDRTGSLAGYRRQRLTGGRRVANTLVQLGQLPYFIRMLAVKVALVSRAYPLLRVLGHDSRDWPY